MTWKINTPYATYYHSLKAKQDAMLTYTCSFKWRCLMSSASKPRNAPCTRLNVGLFCKSDLLDPTFKVLINLIYFNVLLPISIEKKRKRWRAVFLIKITLYDIILSYLTNAFVGILKKISTFPKCMYKVKKTNNNRMSSIYLFFGTNSTDKFSSLNIRWAL